MLNLTLQLFRYKRRIQIDGQDIREVTLDSLRRATALVTQDPFLFDDTIANNIAYGSTSADEAAIEQLYQQAAAHEFITKKTELACDC